MNSVATSVALAALAGFGSPAHAAQSLPSQAKTTPLSSAPLSNDAAVAAARTKVASRAAKLGLSPAEVKSLAVSSVVPTSSGGKVVHFQQRVNGIDVQDAMLTVSVGSGGKVDYSASSLVTSASKKANNATPAISDVRAAEVAADSLGLTPTTSFASAADADGADRERALTTGGISLSRIPVRLVYTQAKAGSLRLAWQLGIDELDAQHYWQIRVDADTARPLTTDDLVTSDSYNAYPTPVEAPTFGSRSVQTNPATTASPFGWHDTNGVAGAESTLTKGNNANAYTDTDNDNLPDPGSQPDGGAGLSFDFPLDLAQQPATYRPAAVTNLFYWNNRIHDVMAAYGFNEASGNFQSRNYSGSGAGNDAVEAQAQDGGGTNNANFFTPADGSAPRMQMYLWNQTSPGRDGDLDNGVIVHEYAHGISNRLTGGPAQAGCLSNAEQAGEGWSDYYAYMLTMQNGVEPAGGRGIGTYVLGQPTTGVGIRTQKYSTNQSINTMTYNSIKSLAVPHGVGSVWAETLWEVTYALIGKYGYSSDLVNGNAGNNLSLRLVTDGLKLQPCSPGFVDARNAILAADEQDTGGANNCLLWNAFAKRGLGFSASQGSSASATDGTEAFDLPASCVAGLVLTMADSPDPVRSGDDITYSFTASNNTDIEQIGCHGTAASHRPGLVQLRVGPVRAVGRKVTGADQGRRLRRRGVVLRRLDAGPHQHRLFVHRAHHRRCRRRDRGVRRLRVRPQPVVDHSDRRLAGLGDDHDRLNEPDPLRIRQRLQLDHRPVPVLRQRSAGAQRQPDADIPEQVRAGKHLRRWGRRDLDGLGSHLDGPGPEVHQQRIQRHHRHPFRQPDRGSAGVHRRLVDLQDVGRRPELLRRPEREHPLPARHRRFRRRHRLVGRRRDPRQRGPRHERVRHLLGPDR